MAEGKYLLLVFDKRNPQLVKFIGFLLLSFSSAMNMTFCFDPKQMAAHRG